MFCKNCGEENPENAVYCRNCGEKLKNEEVKKATVIERETETNNTPKSNDNDWTKCCLCIVALFIAFAIIGVFFR